MEDLRRLDDLISLQERKKTFLLLFYTQTSEKSQAAYQIIDELAQEQGLLAYGVNASVVKDIHPVYKINTVPTVVFFREGKVSEYIYGLQNKEYYKRILVVENYSPSEEGRRFRNVVVYTSPACSWCGTLKDYLNRHRIPFREVDISRDQRAAEELVRRSGQRGVPQTDIDGKIVVGFDKVSLNNLLGIKEN
ncbi:MAG: glutaredoxin [Candidatus Omnitrophica bacterium]|nr:glutaredoxin [Candidatus Omnitrophota bacterium]